MARVYQFWGSQNNRLSYNRRPSAGTSASSTRSRGVDVTRLPVPNPSFIPITMSDPTRPTGDRGSPVHRPVLVREVVQFLDLKPGLIVVDGTVGAGGHSRVLLEHLGPTGKLIGLDRDPLMLARAAPCLADPRCTLRQASYAQLPEILDQLGIGRVDRVLLDLGLSSDQLADPNRGFSFQAAGPLDMRFDTSQGNRPRNSWPRLEKPSWRTFFSAMAKSPPAGRSPTPSSLAVPSRPVRTAADLVEAVADALPSGGRRRS